MKRNERKDVFFIQKCFKTLKPSDELAQNVSNKFFFGRIIPPFSFESSESHRVFKCVHDSNSIFRAAGINSE